MEPATLILSANLRVLDRQCESGEEYALVQPHLFHRLPIMFRVVRASFLIPVENSGGGLLFFHHKRSHQDATENKANSLDVISCKGFIKEDYGKDSAEYRHEVDKWARYVGAQYCDCTVPENKSQH